MAYWIMAYMFKKKLKYIGYGGKGHQVRDVLNVQDLSRLIELQITNFNKFNNETYNIGGGMFSKITLLKLTEMCKEIFNTKIEPLKSKEARPGDIPYYVSDYSKIQKLSGWHPEIRIEKTVEDIYLWAEKNKSKLSKLI